MPLSRRELMQFGIPAVAGAVGCGAAAPSIVASESAMPLPTGLDWPARRKQIERAWLDLLGDFPTHIPPLKVAMREEAKGDGITRYHVSFQAEDDDCVVGYLLVPDSARKKPAPAIICIHSTTWGAGKASTAGLAGRRLQDPPTGRASGRASGLLLAEHGYVTFCIDLLTDGERIKPDERVMDKVYADWDDAEGLPSVVEARKERLGYDKTLEYYSFNNNIKPATIPKHLAQVGAVDCFNWFSFPGGHSYPPVAQALSFAWFDRWLGHEGVG